MYMGKMYLDTKLFTKIAIQNAAQIKADVFGLEVELEGKNIVGAPDNVMEYWDQHNDNSLRKLNPGDQCIEYVSRVPYDLKQTEISLNNLFKFLNAPPAKVYDSYRTSIHVHLNFGLETFRTVYNFMTLSLILDELLVSQNGEHRIGNNFCLRAKDAIGQVVSLAQSVEHGKDFFMIVPHERYSSINFASLMKFGSIEFRSLECTTQLGRVMHWINTLNHMKGKARTFTNPVDVIQHYSQLGPRAFLNSVLGPLAIKYLHVKDYESMLHNGMRLAQDFAYCSAWKEAESR